MSSPALDQCGNGRTELVEEITQLKALLHVERTISHAAGVYEGLKRRRLSSVTGYAAERGKAIIDKRAGIVTVVWPCAASSALRIGDGGVNGYSWAARPTSFRRGRSTSWAAKQPSRIGFDGSSDESAMCQRDPASTAD